MKYILFNKIYINFRYYLKTKHKETYKLSNIHDKNIKKAKLRRNAWINLLVISRGKWNDKTFLQVCRIKSLKVYFTFLSF